MERQAKNVRRMAGVFCGRKAGFEVVHGLLDRMMLGLGVKNLENRSNPMESGYYIQALDRKFPFFSLCVIGTTSNQSFCLDPTFFPNRSAEIFYRPPVVAGAHLTFAPVASVDLANASGTTGPSSTASSEVPSTFDHLKQTLSGALPGANSARDICIGSIGILHPSVLEKFELDFPCSTVEFDLKPFL